MENVPLTELPFLQIHFPSKYEVHRCCLGSRVLRGIGQLVPASRRGTPSIRGKRPKKPALRRKKASFLQADFAQGLFLIRVQKSARLS